MASLTSSSRRSSSSYCSSARYSTSSSYCTERSLGGSSDSLDTILEPFLDYADHSSLFGEEGPGGPNCLAPFRRHSRSSCGYTAPVAGAVTGGQTSTGSGVRCLGDSYYMSVDVSQFEPHDVVVLAYNHHVVIHAQKVLDDGSISDTFTHKSLFPEDMDPLSVSGTFNPDGILVVSVRRIATLVGPEHLGIPTYHSEADL
ncbi:heat shock protein beta-7 [Archocentrus centrarchus]|uniref:heat shock protein beta-7 n=1 Tax=Archocentrus centrarchus TaxID=63155 RepID=UPI0011EA0E61|nr:heat shock protein beta-7-like [Archocentrus centrarchus]